MEVFGLELRLWQQAVHLLLLDSLFLLHPATAAFLRQMHQAPLNRVAVHEIYKAAHSWVVWAGWVVQADASAPPVVGPLAPHHAAGRCEPLVLLLAIHLHGYWAYDMHNRRKFLAVAGVAAAAAAAAAAGAADASNSGRTDGKPGDGIEPVGSKSPLAPRCPSLSQQVVTHYAAAAALVALSFGLAHLIALGLLPAVLPAVRFAQLCPAD